MAQQSLVLPAHVANRTLPQWLLPNLSADELRSCSRPYAFCMLPVGPKMAIKETYRLYTLCAGMFILKSNIVMTHDQSNN